MVYSYITVWIQEAPAPLFKEAFWVIVDGLHDLGPVQALNSFCVLYITRAGEEGEREGEREEGGGGGGRGRGRGRGRGEE